MHLTRTAGPLAQPRHRPVERQADTAEPPSGAAFKVEEPEVQAPGTVDRYASADTFFIQDGCRFFDWDRYCLHRRICSTVHRRLAMTRLAITRPNGQSQIHKGGLA